MIDALHCLPGPLQNQDACKKNRRNRNSNRNNGNGGGNGGGNGNGGGGNDAGPNGTSRSWANWFTGGSGVYNGGEDKQYNNAGVAAGGSFPWLFFGLIGLVSGGGYFAYQTVRTLICTR